MGASTQVIWMKLDWYFEVSSEMKCASFTVDNIGVRRGVQGVQVHPPACC
jgi:hypothetical protein